LARAKSDEGGYLATLADIDSTTLEQANGSILASKPGSILASAEGSMRFQTPSLREFDTRWTINSTLQF
jgi:hypothetical protein